MVVAFALGAAVINLGRSALFAGLAVAACMQPDPARAEAFFVVVSGIGGQPEYEQAFAEYAGAIGESARRTVGTSNNVTVLSGEQASRENFEQALTKLADAAGAADSIAVMLLGHGSYDGEEYKFNLPGRDMSGAEIKALLDLLPAENQLIVNATSASGAVAEEWAAQGRTLITATRSGAERNATRFAKYWAEALSSDAADLNKNGIVTAQEAFDFTARSVADSYEENDSLATEHPQLVGDGADRFNAARLVARVVATPEQRELTAQLEALEEAIAQLRTRRDEMPSDQYLSELQLLLVELATVQRQLDATTAQ